MIIYLVLLSLFLSSVKINQLQLSDSQGVSPFSVAVNVWQLDPNIIYFETREGACFSVYVYETEFSRCLSIYIT
jgi:hypothetical protein